MSVINYSEIYTISLPVQHINEILGMIDPATYLRLFEGTKKEAKYDKNKSDRLNQQNEIELIKKENEEEKTRSRNLISLALLYKTVRSTKFIDGFCTVQLNTMLTFELYSTLSIHINRREKELKDAYDKLEDMDVLTNEYKDLQDKTHEIFKKTEALKELNDYVVKVLRPELIFALMEHYRTLTPRQHAEKCLL